MNKQTKWSAVKVATPLTPAGQAAYDDEARIAAFRGLVHRLRTDAGLTQADLATRMGTTQSAIARMEAGGARPTLETLEKLARAIGADLVVGVAPGIAERTGIKSLLRSGHAVVRTAN